MIHHFQKGFLLTLFLTIVASVSTFAAETNALTLHRGNENWVAKALKLQRDIDINVPLYKATFIGTHNSYNSVAYRIPSLRYLDPNQTLSLYDQLQLGIRSIELDAHWTTDSHFSKDILLCHGLSNHWGCTVFDREFSDGLKEIRTWLQANPNEIILLYIERQLSGHEPRLAAELDAILGNVIFKPTLVRKKGDDAKACVSLPTSLTKAAILKTGKRIIIVTKECDGSNPNYAEQDKFHQQWNDFVFAGIGDLSEARYTFLDSGVSDFKPLPDCATSTTFSKDVKHTTLWRIFEDRTNLSRMLHPNDNKQIDTSTMHQLMQCGINWPTMDMLSNNDARLTAAIWSWAPTYPQTGKGECAAYKKNIGIQNVGCESILPSYACRQEKTDEMKAIAATGKMSYGESRCQLYAGKDWHFTMPVNGAEMQRLITSLNQNGLWAAWVNYTVDKQGQWIIH